MAIESLNTSGKNIYMKGSWERNFDYDFINNILIL